MPSERTDATVPIAAVVMDFDGAICPRDVSVALLEAFGDPAWLALEGELKAGRAGLRETMLLQVALLAGEREEMLRFALGTFPLQPSFAPFVSWAKTAGVRLAVASDGFGFYIEPMLRAAGVEGLPVHSNALAARANGGGRGWGLGFPNANERCVGCGTCKMNVVLRYRRRFGPVAFVGEGHSDRFGALYADVTFAKDELVELCRSDGVPFLPWETFDDVRAGLEALGGAGLPGALEPAVCPGWTEAAP